MAETQTQYIEKSDFYNKHLYSELMTLQLRENQIERGNERNDKLGKNNVCRLYNDLVTEETK